MKVSNNTILITGGATGIGLELAKEFIANGNTVIVCGRREEKLNEAKKINENVVKLTNAFQILKLNAFLDLGSQAFDFDFNIKSQYYFGGISLEWNLFSGNKNKFKVKQAEIDIEIITSQINNVDQQLKLQLQVVQNKFQSAILQIANRKSKI